MMKVKEGIKNAFIDYGVMMENWKLNIKNIKHYDKNSDYALVECEIIKYRCRKPCMKWELYVNMVKGIIDFGKSNFIYL